MYQEVPLVEVENRQQRKEERVRERGGGVRGALNCLVRSVFYSKTMEF